MKYMSVITNFGCHYKCPYCIVKENNLHIPRTSLSGLDNLEEALKENNCDIVSISGVETHSTSTRNTLTGIESSSVSHTSAMFSSTVVCALFLWKCTPAT